MRKIRFGVVGLGHRGRNIFKLAAEGFDFVDPVAVCDIIKNNWYEKQWLLDKPLSEYFPKTQLYDDYDKMLDEAGLDAVIVETGADIHADFCRKALTKNINVLSDIPMVASLDEANYLWKAAQTSKAILSTGANPNEGRFAQMLVEMFQRGLLGEPYFMEAEYIHWWLPGSNESIHLHENGDWRKLLSPIRYCTHSLGPLLKILKEDLTKVSCFGTGPHAEDSNGDDMQCAQFQTESGVVVRLLRNKRCRAKIGNHSFRIFGTEGYFERDGGVLTYMGAVNQKIRYNSMKSSIGYELTEQPYTSMPLGYENNPKATGHGGIDFAMLDHFFRALLAGEPAPISLREGLRMTLPGIYAEESIRRGGEVLRMLYPWNENWKTSFD